MAGLQSELAHDGAGCRRAADADTRHGRSAHQYPHPAHLGRDAAVGASRSAEGCSQSSHAGSVRNDCAGRVFLGLQFNEHYHAYTRLGLTLGSGAYGATFFMLTGFHGVHVDIGATVLSVILVRSLRGDFTPDNQFAFQAASWYWQFVDVIWLLMYVVVYWL